MISLFKTAPKCSAEVLSRVRKHKKTVIGLAEKMHVLVKLCLGMSSSAVGCEFNVNESKYCTSSQRKRKFTNLH